MMSGSFVPASELGTESLKNLSTSSTINEIIDCELELDGTMHGFSISTNFSPVNVVLLLFAGSVHPERGATSARITINVANLCKSMTLSTMI